jgi:hypothetical protein
LTKRLVFAYQLPPQPSAPRVAVWRALKRLPGHYLVDGVFIVSPTELHRLELMELVHDVRNYGGKAVLFVATSDDDADLGHPWRRAKPKRAQVRRRA